MKKRTFALWWIAALTSLWLPTGCGSLAESLQQADAQLQRGRVDEARAAYRAAAAKEYLSPWERDLVRERLADIAVIRLDRQLAAEPPEPALAAFRHALQARREFYADGGGGKRDDVLPEVMGERASAALQQAVSASEAGRPIEAALIALDVVAALGEDAPEPYVKLKTELVGEANALVRTRHAAATKPGIVEIYRRVGATLGGGALSRSPSWDPTQFTVELVASPGASGKCAKWAGAIGAQAARPSRGGVSAKVGLTIAECDTNTLSRTGEETYTYTVSVAYTATESVYVGNRQEVIVRRTCRRGGGLYDELYDCSSYRDVPVYETRSVTRYRDEARTGVRTYTIETNSVFLRGTAEVVWDGGRRQLPVRQNVKVSTRSWRSSQGKSERMDSAKRFPALSERVTREAGAALRDAAMDAVTRERAARALAAADAASSRGDAEEALHQEMIAAGWGHQRDANLAHALSVPADRVNTLMLGKPYGSPLAKYADDRPGRAEIAFLEGTPLGFSIGAGARGFSFLRMGYGGRLFVAPDVPLQTDRTALAYVSSARFMLFSMLAYQKKQSDFSFRSADGFVFYDQFLTDAWVGGLLSDRHIYADDGSKGSPMAWGVGAAYQPMVGVRSGGWGALVGARGAATYREAGGLCTSGYLLPFVVRFEVPVGPRSPLFVEGWGLSLVGGKSWGGSLELVLGKGDVGIALEIERLTLDTVYLGINGDDAVSLGEFDTWIADIRGQIEF